MPIHTHISIYFSLYYLIISFSVAAVVEEEIDVQLLVNGETQTQILKTSTVHNTSDTTGRDFISFYSKGDQVSLALVSGQIYSDSGLQISWGMLHLSAILECQNIFMVGKDGITPKKTRIWYNKELVNVGNQWNSHGAEYTTPMNGDYFVTMSVGSRGVRVVNTDLNVNGKEWFDIYRKQIQGDAGTDTLSRGMMLTLEDNVTVSAYARPKAYSDQNLQTTLGGFLYRPKLGPAICWGVGRTNSWLSDGSSQVIFNVVLSDVGGSWNFSSSEALCPSTGYYFVHFSGASYSEAHLLEVTNFSFEYNGLNNIIFVEIYKLNV